MEWVQCGQLWTVHMGQGGTERRKGSTRALTQAAALSAGLLSASQETITRTRAAGIMENLRLFQNNKKLKQKIP